MTGYVDGRAPMIGWPLDAVVTVDEEAFATYVRLTDATIACTRIVNDLVHVDLDSNGQVVGIEILHSWDD